MLFLYDNAAAISIAAVCSGFAWLYGGTIPSALLPVMPWLLALMCEMSLCFPQRHSGETTVAARARVWNSLKRDPLAWVVLAFLVLLAIPFFNTGLCPCCDYPAIHFDGMKETPPYIHLPYCVNRLEHLSVVVWFVPALTAALACRHALLKRGKRMFLELMVWSGLGLAAIGVLQRVTGAEGPLWLSGNARTAYFFSTFGYPNMGGDYFTTLFAISVALWRWKSARTDGYAEGMNDVKGKSERVRFWRKHLMLVFAVVFFFCAVMTLSRASILLVSTLALVFFVHTSIVTLSRMDKVARLKALVADIVVLLLAAIIAAAVLSGHSGPDAPKADETDLRDDVAREVSSLDGRGILDRLSGREQYHTRVAREIWKDHFLFGCGGWGYKHLCIPRMTEEEYKHIQMVGGINVHNDYIQFLAEHGTVGFLFLVAIFAILLYPVASCWSGLAKAARFSKGQGRPPRPVSLFALPGSAFCMLCAIAATMVHALGDCPLRSPAVLSLFFVSIAATDGFMPRMAKKDK